MDHPLLKEADIVNCIERLSLVVQEENAALESCRVDGIGEYLTIKNERLLELFRILNESSGIEISESAKSKLVSLRSLLEVNLSRLKIHCDAIEFVLAVVRPKQSSIRDFIY